MTMLLFPGVKRTREGRGLCEAEGVCRLTCLSRNGVTTALKRRVVEKTSALEAEGDLGLFDADGCADKFTNSTFVYPGVRRGVALAGPTGSCVGCDPQRGNGGGECDGAEAVDTAGSRPVSALSLPDRSVVVDVTRGDTGRCCHFTFALRLPSHFFLHAGEEEEEEEEGEARRKAYRDAVVRDLVQRVCVEAALTPGRAWMFVFCGRDLQSEAGALSLMSALHSESCQHIRLAVFYGPGKR